MSRSFVKEDDLEHAGINLPERSLSTHTNYVTPQGLSELHSWLKDLQNEQRTWSQQEGADAVQKLATLARDVRYVQARISNAVLVEEAKSQPQVVVFGCLVSSEDDEGQVYTVRIVGEDEANVLVGKISYVSPLARALLGHKVGDSVMWQRPMGACYLEILSIQI